MTASVADAHQYCLDVVGGQVVACQWVKLSCQRHLNDLQHGAERGLWFDDQAAQHALDFYDFTTHIKGALAGQVIELEPWQAFIIASIFGWKNADGLRRFRTAYNEVGRKNAKSMVCSGVGLYMTGFDNEGGAEVYSCASTRDQAKIVWHDAKLMAERSPVLRRLFATNTQSIHVLASASKFEPLSSDANTLDGKNVHCGIIDELHAHRDRTVWDVIETGTGAREQPLIFAITTAGSNKQGICYEVREYATKVLLGVVEDDSFFAIIYTLDDGDDWRDEANWIKSNPNLGKSVKWDDIRRLAKKANEMPTARNNFLTKRLNVWVSAATGWLNMQRWERCPPVADDDALAPLPCWVGLDLANKLDVAALVMAFPLEDGSLHLKARFWLPEEAIEIKSRSIGNMYQAWAESGYMTLTEGSVIDHDQIEDEIREILSEYEVQEVAFDPWGSVQLANHLAAEGAPMVEVPQTVKNLSEAMKEVEALTIAGRLHHGDNPVLNWMASNVTAKVDKNENVFPNKDHPDSKIDGMVALFIAVSRILRHQEDEDPYAERGIRTL